MPDMSDRVQHCPFLNRTDSRCGSHFTLEKLEHAFEYCFDRYADCPVYQELLLERRVRRGEASRLGAVAEECQTEHAAVTAHVAGETSEPNQDGTSHDIRPLVEITIHARPRPHIASICRSSAPKRAA